MSSRQASSAPPGKAKRSSSPKETRASAKEPAEPEFAMAFVDALRDILKHEGTFA